MDHATKSRAAQIGAACLLAVLALLLARAPWASARETASRSEGPTCQRGVNQAQAMDAAVAEAMEQRRREQAEAAADPSGWVVLNNRGFNYGPPPPVRIDPDFFLADPTGAAH